MCNDGMMDKLMFVEPSPNRDASLTNKDLQLVLRIAAPPMQGRKQNSCDLNWKFLFAFAPRLEYPPPPTLIDEQGWEEMTWIFGGLLLLLGLS